MTTPIATTQHISPHLENHQEPRRARSVTRRLLMTELKLVTRDPLTLFFVVMFPILTMLIIGGSFGSEPNEVFPVNPSHWYVASYFTVVIGATGLIMLPVHIASYRERGVLRRFAAAGFPPVVIRAGSVGDRAGGDRRRRRGPAGGGRSGLRCPRT